MGEPPGNPNGRRYRLTAIATSVKISPYRRRRRARAVQLLRADAGASERSSAPPGMHDIAETESAVSLDPREHEYGTT